jgi:hypothetical protein
MGGNPMRTTITAVEQGVDAGLLRPTLMLRYIGAPADPAPRRQRGGKDHGQRRFFASPRRGLLNHRL